MGYLPNDYGGLSGQSPTHGLEVAGCLFLASCAQQLISGNSAGGMVSGGDNVFESRAGAMAIADRHCQQFGKVSRVSGQDPWAGTLIFECVA